MGMDLILWKAPVIDDTDEAARLLEPYFERGDDSAFEPSDDVTAVSNELARRFPDAIDGPWGDPTAGKIDRVLLLSMSWSVSDTVIDAVGDLARKHGLVLYDPQGPDITLPTDPVDAEPAPPTTRERLGGYLTIVLIGAAAAGTFWLGWWIDVPILDWALMIIGGFFFSVVVFLLWILLFGARDDKADQRPAT
jgi:hypothetical protein